MGCLLLEKIMLLIVIKVPFHAELLFCYFNKKGSIKQKAEYIETRQWTDHESSPLNLVSLGEYQYKLILFINTEDL